MVSPQETLEERSVINWASSYNPCKKNICLLCPFFSLRIRALPCSSIKKPAFSQNLPLPPPLVRLWICKWNIVLTQHPSRSVQPTPVCSLHPAGRQNGARLSPHAASHPIQHPADTSKCAAGAESGQETTVEMKTVVCLWLGDSCRKLNQKTSCSTRY